MSVARLETVGGAGGATLLSSKNGWWPGDDNFAKFSEPEFSFSVEEGKSFLKKGGRRVKLEGDPLSHLDDLLGRGYFAVGYIGYEFFRHAGVDFSQTSRKESMGVPDAFFMFFDDVVSRGKTEELGAPRTRLSSGAPRPNMEKSRFLWMVRKIQDYIARGDVYQVNISQRFDVELDRNPGDLLLGLYRAQPVPFSCSLDFGEFQIVSGSMELFLRKNGKRIVTRPIKGTRPRGRDRREDSALREELLKSEKERAENLMIVDLMRNDLGRVCEFGSVRVNDLFDIEEYSTLYQMVSEVEGKLRDGATAGEIIRETFPPGSVTGAPKVRAMEIIDELEPHLRGPYCGAIGLFKPDGDFDLSVAIRVLAASGGNGNFWVGGGITWGSVPEREYEETLVKAQATMRALGWENGISVSR